MHCQQNIKWNSETVPQPTDIIRTQYVIPNAFCAAPAEDEQVMLETCGGHWLSINWMESASRWFHYTDAQFNLVCMWPLKNQWTPDIAVEETFYSQWSWLGPET
jgi:hypothetical protein